ncbi:hypothetical protein OA90_27750 [Labrenzia sp. OB1]|nr:hypothetical protein OA90_27750 [Labrenzia sp. OB1]
MNHLTAIGGRSAKRLTSSIQISAESLHQYANFSAASSMLKKLMRIKALRPEPTSMKTLSVGFPGLEKPSVMPR